MNQYTITSIDSINNLVYASYEYNGNFLDDRLSVSSVNDPSIITTVVSAGYEKFKSDIDALNNPPPLPTNVSSLIGQSVTVDQSSLSIVSRTSLIRTR